MKNVQDARKEFILNKQMNYNGEILTRSAWLKRCFKQGAFIVLSESPKIKFNRLKYNRMNGREQEQYEKQCSIMIPCYELHFKNESGFYDITKTEYDYFLNLQLECDMLTEKMEMPYKIEAGTATNKEVHDYMQKDFDFINTYYK